MRHLLLIFIILLLLSCCNSNTTNEEKVLNLSENLIDNNPDSALFLIRSIHTLKYLTEDQISKYELLKIRAKDMCLEDISSDTIIFKVRSYYLQGGCKIDIALSSLYAGLVLFEQGNNTKAMLMLLEAEKYVNDIPGNHKLKGLIQSTIGHVFYRELLIDEALKRFKVAMLHFSQSGEYTNEAITYNQIGLCFLMKESINDSASFYFKRGLDIADRSGDTNLKSSIRLNIGLLWSEQRRSTEAITYFKDALKYTNENNEKAKILHNIAKEYLYNDKIDSAQYFVKEARNLAKLGTEFPIMKYLNELESQILKYKGKYREALVLNEDFLKYMEEEFLKNENKTVLDIEKKYNYELLQNKHNELLIKNQRWIIILLLLLIMFVTLGICYRFKSYQDKKALEEAEQKIISFTDMVNNYKQKYETLNLKDETFKTVLFEHFNILKKAALLEGYLKQEDKENGAKILRKFNEILYGKEKLDWGVLYNSMNKLHDGFLDLLHKSYPELDNEEFNVCCLIYNDFSNTEISIITGLSNRTITSRRSSIRKKIGIDDYGNINEFFKLHVKY